MHQATTGSYDWQDLHLCILMNNMKLNMAVRIIPVIHSNDAVAGGG